MLVFSVLMLHFRIPNPSIHDALIIAPPAPPAPAKIPHVELPHTMLWSPMGQSFTTTTLFNGLFVAQMGNDAGILVPHISIPINNALLPLTIATSMCKNVFGAGTVLVEKKPAAGFFPMLAPILTCCFPIPVPWHMLPLPCSVWIGMTFADFMAGWARVAVSVAVAAVFARFGGKIPGFDRIGNAGGSLASRLAARLGGKVIAQAIAKEYGKALAEDLFKGLTVSLITEGKVEAPYQIAEFNPWTGEGKVFTTEGRAYQGTTNVSVGNGINAAQTAADAPDTTYGAADGLPAAN